MNHSILVVICDFLVLSVLSLSLGVAPMSSSFMGRGTQIDDYTANILLDELKAKCVQLRKARATLLKSQRKLGYAETRSKQVKKLNDTLAKVQVRLNYLEVKLKSRKGEIGKLSKEKLLARLEKESIRRLKVVNEMSAAKAALEFEQAKNRKLASKAVVLRQNVILRDDKLAARKSLLDERAGQLKKVSEKLHKTAAELSSAEKKLQKTKTVLSSMEGKLQKTASALDSAHGSLQKKASDLNLTKMNLQKKTNELIVSKHTLNVTKLRLRDIAMELKGSQGEAKASLLDLSYTRGRLSATEKELAESRGRLAKTRKNVAVNQLELKDARKKIINLKKILESAVGDLSKTQNELNQYKSRIRDATETLAKTKIKLIKTSSSVESAQMALKDTKESLKDTKESLKEAVHRLQSKSLEKYSQAAVLLKVNIQERRFFINYEKSGMFYLPEVLVAGKRYLISPLELFNRLGRLITKSSRINKLSYLVGKPKNGDNLFQVKKPLLSLNVDNRVCMLEVPAVRKTSLKLLTYGKLKKRGLQNLTLFKNMTFGRDSSSLNGRCSLGLKKGDNYLYIRNSVRKNAPQLKAEVGDFIITKQGEFVGIAVKVENFNLARKQRVKCFVFPDKFNVKDLVEIPLIKRSGEEYFRGFAKAVAEINSRIKHLSRINRAKKSP